MMPEMPTGPLIPPPYNREVVVDIINLAYKPFKQKLELVSHQEVMEYLSKISKVPAEDAYTILQEMGFKHRRIDDTPYWEMEEE